MGICPQLTIVILGWSRRVVAVKIIFLLVVLLLLVLLGVLALGWLLGSVGCVAGCC